MESFSANQSPCYSEGMAKRKDPVETARSIFDDFLSKADPDSVTAKPEPEGKDPKRQRAGRMGGLKGGKVRALRLSVKRRKEIAQKAAKSRWNKGDNSD